MCLDGDLVVEATQRVLSATEPSVATMLAC